MWPKFKQVFSVVLLILGLFVLYTCLRDSWHFFLTQCPNKDVLSWDANLRFRKVLDLYQSVLAGNYLAPLQHAFLSPTWPSLRSFIALGVIITNPAGPDPVRDVAISFIFYILSFGALFMVALVMLRDLFKASLAWFVSIHLVIFSRYFTSYALSSMLETQGMFFMLMTILFLYRIYEQQRARQFWQYTGRPLALANQRRYWLGLFLFAQALFHTKFPYGLMLLIAIVIFEFLRQPQPYLELVSICLQHHYLGWRRYFLLATVTLVGGMILLLLGAHFIPTLPATEFVFSKLMRNLIWLISLGIFIDFNIYLYHQRHQISQIFDRASRSIYIGIVAPTVFWLVLHPDRMGSIVGTQQHQQEASRSYFYSFIFDIFDRFEPILIIVSLLLATLIALFWYLNRGISARNTLKAYLRHPLVAVWLVLFLQFLILEETTSNKQLRHIFHLVPALLIVATVLIFRLPRLLCHSHKKLAIACFALSRLIYLIPLASVGLFYIPDLKTPPQHLNQTPLANYTNDRVLCFTDFNPAIYQPVRELIQPVELEGNTLLFNQLHNPMLLHPSRAYATEFDVLLRMKAIRASARFQIRNYEDYKTLARIDFQKAIAIQTSCQSQLIQAKIQAVIQKHQAGQIQLQNSFQSDKAGLCLQVYTITDSVQSP